MNRSLYCHGARLLRRSSGSPSIGVTSFALVALLSVAWSPSPTSRIGSGSQSHLSHLKAVLLKDILGIWFSFAPKSVRSFASCSGRDRVCREEFSNRLAKNDDTESRPLVQETYHQTM